MSQYIDRNDASAQYQQVKRLNDATHLRLIEWGHYALGALTILSSSLVLFLYEICMRFARQFMGRNLPPNTPDIEALYHKVVVITLAGTAAMLILHGTTLIYFGRQIRHRKHRIMTIIFEAMNVTMVPIGTLLSVFSIIVLVRKSVIGLFNHQAKPLNQKTSSHYHRLD